MVHFSELSWAFPHVSDPAPPSSYCLRKVPKRQQWGHGPHCSWYKQVLPEKEARFLSSRKSFLLSWNLKIPEGMKGQGRNERRGRESWLARSWRGNIQGRDNGDGRRGEIRRSRRPRGGACVREAAITARQSWPGPRMGHTGHVRPIPLCLSSTKACCRIKHFYPSTLLSPSHINRSTVENNIHTTFFKSWSTADLQCCVNFCYTAKWFGYTYTNIFFIFFSIMIYYRILNIVPCATQQGLVVYLFYI